MTEVNGFQMMFPLRILLSNPSWFLHMWLREEQSCLGEAGEAFRVMPSLPVVLTLRYLWVSWNRIWNPGGELAPCFAVVVVVVLPVQTNGYLSLSTCKTLNDDLAGHADLRSSPDLPFIPSFGVRLSYGLGATITLILLFPTAAPCVSPSQAPSCLWVRPCMWQKGSHHLNPDPGHLSPLHPQTSQPHLPCSLTLVLPFGSPSPDPL